MLELIFKQIMVMSPSNIEEHKVARGVILIKCCDLKVFKHLGWCERSSNPERSGGEVTEGTGGLSYPLRSCGNQLCFIWQFIGHIAQIRRSVHCSQPQCIGPQFTRWPTDAYIAHKTGQCFFDLARSYLIGCLCATSESKGHTGFISLPCKQSCVFKDTMASPIIIITLSILLLCCVFSDKYPLNIIWYKHDLWLLYISLLFFFSPFYKPSSLFFTVNLSFEQFGHFNITCYANAEFTKKFNW